MASFQEEKPGRSRLFQLLENKARSVFTVNVTFHHPGSRLCLIIHTCVQVAAMLSVQYFKQNDVKRRFLCSHTHI